MTMDGGFTVDDRVEADESPQGQQHPFLTWEFDHVPWQAGLTKRGHSSDAADARLEAMRRRVHLTHVAVRTVTAAGPTALAVTVASTPTTDAAAPTAKPTTMPTADPSSYAQVLLGAWLHSNANDDTSTQTRLAQSAPGSVTAVRSAQWANDAWSVTVAAQYAGGSVRYYAVPVTADHAGSSFTVTGAPAVVAGPARAEVPKSS